MTKERKIELLTPFEAELKKMIPAANFFGITSWTDFDLRTSQAEINMPDFEELKKLLEKKNPLGSNQIKDAFFLVYIPENLTLKKLEKIDPKKFRITTDKKLCWYRQKNFISEKGSGNWHLIFPRPIPGSIGKEFDEQKKLIPIGKEWEIPKALTMTATHFIFNYQTGKDLNPQHLGRTRSVDGQDRITIGRDRQKIGIMIGRSNDEDGEIETGLFTEIKVPQKKIII